MAAFRGDYLMTLFEYNLAVAELDKSIRRFPEHLPAEGKPEKDITPGRAIQPASATAAGRPNRPAAVTATKPSGQAPGPALFYQEPLEVAQGRRTPPARFPA